MAVARTALHDTNASKKRKIIHVGPGFAVVLEGDGVKPKHLLLPRTDLPLDNLRLICTTASEKSGKNYSLADQAPACPNYRPGRAAF